MNSQIVANIDSDLKKAAMDMAKKNWITLKSLISILLKSYVDKEIKLWARMQRDYCSGFEQEEWTLEEIKLLENDKDLKKIEKGFNNLIA